MLKGFVSVEQRTNILSFDEAKTRGSVRSRATEKPSSRPSVNRRRTTSSVESTESRIASQTSSRSGKSASRNVSRHVDGGSESIRGRSASATGARGRADARTGSSRSSRNGEGQRSSHRESVEKTSRFESLRKKHRSRKADRAFDRTIASRESDQAPQTSRAALYEMRMGPSHKKSSRMQDEGVGKPFSAKRGFSLPASFFLSRWAIALCGVVFAVVMLYQPLADYYGEVRQLQQLEAEYSALESHNELLQSQIDYLNTDEGLEDYARSELGWVRPDDNVVVVEGVQADTSSTDSGDIFRSIPSDTVAAPATWYSGVLDAVFGYGGK